MARLDQPRRGEDLLKTAVAGAELKTGQCATLALGFE